MSYFVQGVQAGLVGAGAVIGFGACAMVFIMLVSFAVWCFDRAKGEDETEDGEDGEDEE